METTDCLIAGRERSPRRIGTARLTSGSAGALAPDASEALATARCWLDDPGGAIAAWDDANNGVPPRARVAGSFVGRRRDQPSSDPKTASDLLCVLPLLTCGHSRRRVVFPPGQRVLRTPHQQPTDVPGLFDFSLLPVDTVLRRSVPLYGWKVTRQRPRRRERSAGRPLTVFGPRRRKRARWWRGIRDHRRGSGPRAGTEPRAERHEA
jgi:hypothetical protein